MAGKISGLEKKRKYRRLLERDGDKCFWCDIKFSEEWPYTLDHLVTQAAGGGNQLENLVLACDYCNNRRGDMTAGAFRSWIRKHNIPVERRRKLHQHPNQVAERSRRVDWVAYIRAERSESD